MLLYAWLGQEPETVAAGVAIASPSQFEHQRVPWTLGPIRWALWGKGYVHVRALAALSRPLGSHNPQLARLANRDNLDPDIAAGLAAHALSDVPKPLARQALMWARTDTLLSVDGDPWLVSADVPLLVLGGPARPRRRRV